MGPFETENLNELDAMGKSNSKAKLLLSENQLGSREAAQKGQR
jgi:hypothetical protein